MQQAFFQKLTKYRLALLCVAAMLVCLAVSYPIANIAYCDDFAYIWCARVLAATGHVVFNGGEAAMMGWQLYFGAFWIKLFGSSFTSMHVSMLVISVPTVVLMQRILVRLGVRERLAVLGTLTVCLSPLFLALAFSFMSDVPGLLVLELCLYGLLRMLSARTDRAALGWLLFAGLSNLAGGTVRQITWLGVLVMLPCAAWLARKRRGIVPVAAALWVVSFLLIQFCTHWFNRQPYIVGSSLRIECSLGDLVRRRILRGALTVVMYTLPTSVAFLLPDRDRRSYWVRMGGIVAAAAAITAAIALWNPVWLAPFTFDQTGITLQGLNLPGVPGVRATAIPFPIQCLLTILTISCGLMMLRAGWRAARLGAGWRRHVLSSRFFVLLLPFAVVYGALVVTRSAIFDRYYLPLIFLLLAAVLRTFQAFGRAEVSKLSAGVLVLFTAFSIITVHDLYASQRARVAAADALQRRGLARTEFYAGFEYDGWTELEQRGFVSDERMRNPPGANRTAAPLPIAGECVPFYAPRVPAIHARVELAFQPLNCLPQAAGIAPLEYRAWLPPFQRKVYFLALPPAAAAQ